jgi:VWFA-related protein
MRAISRRRSFPAIRPRLQLLVVAGAILASLLAPRFAAQTTRKEKLPKVRQLDKGILWRRDPSSGELTVAGIPSPGSELREPPPGGKIINVVRLVPVTCSVFDAAGEPLRGLRVADFRVYEDGQERPIDFFSAESGAPASVALVIDASPSVLRDSKEMDDAARALLDTLARSDEVAIVDFAAHTYLQLGFSSDRELLTHAIARVDVRSLLSDTGGSNVYQSVYLTAGEFAARKWRKAIVLFTDGQDSGLGLSLDPASAAPQPGTPNDRLTFEDVARELERQDIQLFAVSTENRPPIMTRQWFASHRETALLTSDTRKQGIPAYTLYLAELARRTGGDLYFLHEADSLALTLQQIASRIRAEYWLGFTPGADAGSEPRAGWHALRVEVEGHRGATAVYRPGYNVAVRR